MRAESRPPKDAIDFTRGRKGGEEEGEREEDDS